MIMDNHQLHDPADAVAPERGSPANATARRAQRQLVFSQLVDLSRDHTIIFTSCSAANEKDKEIFAEYLELARKRDQKFIWFNLAVAEEEHIRRGTDFRRTGERNGKLTGEEMLLIMREHSLLTPDHVKELLASDGSPGDVRQSFLSIDITGEQDYAPHRYLS